MSNFINTIEVLGDTEVFNSIVDGSITEYADDTITKISNFTFAECKSLIKVDCLLVTAINMNAFFNSYSLSCLILRSETMCTLASTDSFTNCYHYKGTVNATYNPDGLKDGYIYVPKALLSDEDSTKDYRRATNWTTFADQFRALEDYTVDGTITGELDESKI